MDLQVVTRKTSYLLASSVAGMFAGCANAPRSELPPPLPGVGVTRPSDATVSPPETSPELYTQSSPLVVQPTNSYCSTPPFSIQPTQDGTAEPILQASSIALETATGLTLVQADETETDKEKAEAEKPTAGVEHFVGIALASHPKIMAARQRFAAATNVPVQAAALPDPIFSNTFWPIHDSALQTAGGRIGNQMNLSQQVPWPEKLDAKAEIATHEIRMAQAEVDAAEREIIESVRLAYYELWYAHQAISIIKDIREVIVDLEEVAKARYQAGGTQQDVLRAQLERDRLDDQLISLEKQKEIAKADLATLLRQPTDLLPKPSEELDDDGAAEQLDQLIAMAEQCNPSLQGLAAEIQRDRSRERLACLQQYPDLNVGMHWGIISDQDAISPIANGNDNFSFTVGTTVPIRKDKINGGIREAAHRRSSTVQRYEAERDIIAGKLRRLVVQADALLQQKSLYNDRILPRTKDTLDLTVTDYQGKRADFFSVVETYRELLTIEMQLARINATLAGTIAQIDRTVGCPAN